MSCDSDEIISSAMPTPATLQPRRRCPKVDRATDKRTPWTRTSWEGHLEAKVRENSWYSYYHMPIDKFDKLHGLLFRESPQEIALAKIRAQSSTRMGPIDTRVKLASTMRILFGEKQKSMVDVFKISECSAHTALFNVIDRINACPDLDGNVFNADHTIPTLEKRAGDFAVRSSFPRIMRHCVGAIDGLLIKTQQPEAKEVGNVRSFYSGHKKGFGLNMQGVCDSECRFTGFSCNTAGSTSDYTAFRHAHFYGLWPMLPQPFFYFGDCAYPLSPNLITPYIGTQLSADQDAFNFFHSQLRITIERTFGIFVNVFAIFHAPLQCSIANACKIVEACVKLHNYRINEGCQNVARRSSTAAVYREAFDRADNAFDVLDDTRFATHRPYASDHALGQHVAAAELFSGLTPSDAALGAGRRAALTDALRMQGAERPAANVYA